MRYLMRRIYFTASLLLTSLILLTLLHRYFFLTFLKKLLPLFVRAPGRDRLYCGEAKRDAGVLTKLN